MNLAIIMTFLAVVTLPTFGGLSSRSTSFKTQFCCSEGKTSTTSCQVFGSVSLVAKSGSCKGWPGASCTSHAYAESNVENAVKEILTNDLCSRVSAESAATAAATAVASVYFEALLKVSCDGQGVGCGFSVARGDSFATAYAEAFARAVAVAAAGDSSAVCMGDLTAIAVGFAQAAAEGSASACVEGSGSAEAFRSEFVDSATTAIAEALAIATSEVCTGELSPNSECGVDAEGSSTANNFDSGMGAQTPVCTGVKEYSCCFHSDSCDRDGLWPGIYFDHNGHQHMLVFPKGVMTPLCHCY